MDIVPDLIPDDVDDMERLRGELPNGGSRILPQRNVPQHKPSQTKLDLDVPVLSDDQVLPQTAQSASMNPTAAAPTGSHQLRKPAARQAPPRRRAESQIEAGQTDEVGDKLDRQSTQVDDEAASLGGKSMRSNSVVREVQVELPTTASHRSKVIDPIAQSDVIRAEPNVRRGTSVRRAAGADQKRVEVSQPAVDELLVINLIARKGHPFVGEDLVNALRGQGLRYGDMSVFHRLEHTTKAKLFSVANIIEPGTFDLADLDSLSSPGMTFFLQLPGPDHALDAFEDMLKTARNISVELGGEVRDENLVTLTRQSAEHMRQRISDFARKRLSIRA